MIELDRQLDYWDTKGTQKSFAHPLNLQRLDELLRPDSLIIDFGCGYGRCLGELFDAGYCNLIGLDFSPAMIAAAREHLPNIKFEELRGSKCPLSNESVDAALLFSVLTCVPTDDGQRGIIEELYRVLKPGGLLYISDLWLQADERNKMRYAHDEPKYGIYGVFDLPEGVTVRHHDPNWIEILTTDFDRVALDDIDVLTMNGNPAKAFQWFGLREAQV
jgi:SAM-dependent methyltransferase